jgi:hypothetical protein
VPLNISKFLNPHVGSFTQVDRVLVIKNGTVYEQGSVKELMNCESSELRRLLDEFTQSKSSTGTSKIC